MKSTHPLAEAVSQAEGVYQELRAYALSQGLVAQDHEGYLLLAQLRELLTQSKGIADGFERRM